MNDSIILLTLFVIAMTGIVYFLGTADSDNKLARICIKILRIISFPGLIMAGALFCFFASLATAPVRFAGPMNMNPFGTIEASLWIGIPLLLPVLACVRMLLPFRRFTKWTLLVIGAIMIYLTLINFFHFPISAYIDESEMFDICKRDNCAPPNLGCLAVSIVFALMFIGGFIYLHLGGRRQPDKPEQSPSATLEV